MSFDLFKAPIPGQSLTSEVGSAPHEMPPQYTDINDALEFIFSKLTEPRQVTRLVLVLKKGMPVEYLARAILFEGFSKGNWTPDMAMLMLRIVMTMIISIAVQKGVKPKIFNPDKSQNDFLDNFLDINEEPQQQAQNALPEGMPSEFTGLLGAQL